MWLALGPEIALEFSDIRYVPDSDGTRFFRFDSEAEVERVANWRKRNRSRRNATARETYAADPGKQASATERWRARNTDKVRAARDRENEKRRARPRRDNEKRAEERRTRKK